MDAGATKVSDVCRHLQQMFEEFDEDVNEGRTVEAKWWWVQRRIRSVFEVFWLQHHNAAHGLHPSEGGVEPFADGGEAQGFQGHCSQSFLRTT